MRWILYNIVFAVAYVLALPHYWARMRKRGGYRRDFMQRFGVYTPPVTKALQSRRRLWIHAVSVGEIHVALNLMTEMRRRDPSLAFVLTTNTPTARGIGEQAITEADLLLYFPVDLPCVMKHVLKRMQPQALILTEKEFWPNLIRLCAAQAIPIFLVNGRMSDRSAGGYRRVRWFFAPVLHRLTLALAQSDADRERLIALGTRPERTQVTGSAKYGIAHNQPPDDARARALLAVAGTDSSSILLLGGSTWPGEEKALCNLYRTLRTRYPRLRLVLVPRHAERRAEVARDVSLCGLIPVLRSQIALPETVPNQGDSTHNPDHVLIVDSTGELASFYACADIVFVGKSLGKNHGGQNIIEPAWLGKPVITGPHMENFPVIMDDFMTAKAITRVADEKDLERTLDAWLTDLSTCQAQGSRARALVNARRDSLRISVELILKALQPPSGADPS